MKRVKGRLGGGFTLVELLVVIAIIGVLMAILIPAVSAGKRRACELKCMNHLRQLVIGVVSYADDHRSRLPAVWESTADGASQWADAISTYLGSKWRDTDKSQTAQNRQVFFCPMALRRHSPAKYNHFIGRHGSYGMNWALDGVSLGSIKEPAQTILLMDGIWDEGDVCWSAGVDFDNPPEPIHGDGANIAFLDSHVTWLEASEYQKGKYWDENEEEDAF